MMEDTYESAPTTNGLIESAKEASRQVQAASTVAGFREPQQNANGEPRSYISMNWHGSFSNVMDEFMKTTVRKLPTCIATSLLILIGRGYYRQASDL